MSIRNIVFITPFEDMQEIYRILSESINQANKSKGGENRKRRYAVKNMCRIKSKSKSNQLLKFYHMIILDDGQYREINNLTENT